MQQESGFESFGLQQETLAAIDKMGFKQPTSVQSRTIPPMMDWHDIIVKAPTGTGKTIAFGIPIIEHIQQSQAAAQALILAPTRELAMQITEEIRTLASGRTWLRAATLYGGQSIRTQIEQLKKKPQILIATPGRLLDHMKRRTLRLDLVDTVVLDEADRMLDMGFIRDVRRILDAMPRVAQIAMFSATLSRAVMDISWLYQREPVEITVEESGLDKPQITEYLLKANGSERIVAISHLVKKEDFDRALIFVNTRQSATMVTRKLKAAGLDCDCIHGDIRQSQRERVLARFRKGNLRLLVATDVAARGLDIDDVDAVFNYDLPQENESYIHRIGRTGRARKKGVAYTFVSPAGQRRVDDLVRHAHAEFIPLSILRPDQ